MSEEILAKAHEVLDNYMESNHHRRTPERSTILDTIYSMGAVSYTHLRAHET